MTLEDPRPADRRHCITCSDEGIPMRVVECRSGSIALCVDHLQEPHTVATDLVEEVEPGDTLLVHAGVAIARAGAPP